MNEQQKKKDCITLEVKQMMVAAIAPWFRLHLPSCGPGFESQAHLLCFFPICIEIVTGKELKYTKRGRDWPIF